MEKKSMTVPYMPLELIIEILLRLSVKCLACFKCVSKSWLSLISDHNFAKLHFQRNIAIRRILLTIEAPLIFHSLDFESSISYHSATSISLPPPTDVKIKGSCRGFSIFF
ncbi:putative F-box domain-containing protein [Medicago truncatula]|uniref:Putative F-box domain-containing protein n=1 Tax=Medicago truncatula TaxID=3880 RepID=A0A396IKM2_MEDTR|nr:putative F-box domain-containing protein [Medicago truncatula]